MQILDDGSEYHAPLTHGGFTWNVHYVACCGDEAHEPLLGEAPVPVRELALRLFGRALEVVKVMGEVELAAVLRDGTYRERVKTLRRSGRMQPSQYD